MPKNQLTITPEQLFRELADLGVERPAAFYAYGNLAGIPESCVELAMHGSEIGEAERKYLHDVFDGEIPATLLSDDFDT